jgi:hypothetical protein
MGIAGDWRELNNEELHDLCFSLCIIRMIVWKHSRWAEQVACTDASSNVCMVFGGQMQNNENARKTC